jgi:nickel transport protein
MVEAKFSNGNAVQQAEVRVLDGENVLLMTMPIEEDGTVTIPLADVDHSGGLVIEVDTGSHENYWIVTPDDITRSCQS